MTIEYRQLAIAFIDILGFASLVKQSDTSEVALQRVQDALGALERAKRQIEEQFKESASIQPDLDGMERITVFSDSVILSGPNIGSVLIHAFTIAHQLMAAGFLCRGAVVRGKACHTDTRIVGPAFIDAYVGESQLARYPRIILARQLAEGVINQAIGLLKPMFARMLKPGEDGWWYIDVFSGPISAVLSNFKYSDTNPDMRQYYEQAAQTIHACESDERLDVQAKHCWAKTQFLKGLSDQSSLRHLFETNHAATELADPMRDDVK